MPGTLLAPGEQVFLAFSGETCRVQGLLGAGGQGEVHEVLVDDPTNSNSYALKVYQPHAATKEQWEALSVLVDLGSPGDRFLWPIDVAELPERQTFGYLMAIRDGRYRGLADLARRAVRTTFSALATAGFQLVDSFLRLHSRGLCYRDISLGNVFFDPASGDILICDNDNVAVDGEGHESVLGTSGFMAPEVERLEALPSTKTDLYSLSVLLFLMLVNHHPLIGKREMAFSTLDRSALASLYGQHPVFVFDPTDDSNRPIRGVHDNALVLWPLFPTFVRDLFTAAFTRGLHEAHSGRVRESTWKRAMARLRDSIMSCGCGAQLFFDDDVNTVAGAPPGTCWACGGRPGIPPRLILSGKSVVLNEDTRLFAHHLAGRLYDYEEPLAEISRHPLDPRVRGLRNLSGTTWLAVEPDGTEHHVGRGRSVRIEDGMQIHFMRADGVFVVEDATAKGNISHDEGGRGW